MVFSNAPLRSELASFLYSCMNGGVHQNGVFVDIILRNLQVLQQPDLVPLQEVGTTHVWIRMFREIASPSLGEVFFFINIDSDSIGNLSHTKITNPIGNCVATNSTKRSQKNKKFLVHFISRCFLVCRYQLYQHLNCYFTRYSRIIWGLFFQQVVIRHDACHISIFTKLSEQKFCAFPLQCSPNLAEGRI
eukprot:Lithocolla_globosa_v1_NODE_570_length_3712_cov_22.282199.p3 type:complete len:190 gc:universal NODE_570_length_3712_cov_22.282199:1211-642(-)